jgi:hypothetical protein
MFVTIFDKGNMNYSGRNFTQYNTDHYKSPKDYAGIEPYSPPSEAAK